MAMSLSEVGASVGEYLEVGDLDGMDLGSIETTWFSCLWKTILRRVPNARMAVTTKIASLIVGFLKKDLP